MRLIITFALVLAPAICKAGGTVEFQRVDHLLQQKPEIREVLLRSLVMPGVAFAQVRLGDHFRHLGGNRLGPYTFKASSRNTTAAPVLVTLCTSAVFVDSSDRVLPTGDEELEATGVRELLNAVVLRDAGVSAAATCP